MNIDIWYDPVYVETRTCIDGFWQDISDIYGFLYPVLHYPMQTWLNENGSWSGLYNHLIELVRGEELKLVFHGRKIDYIDLKQSLHDKAEISLEYKPWDAENLYLQRIRKADQLLQQIEDVLDLCGNMPETKDSCFDAARISDWCFELKDEKKLFEASKSGLPCVLISNNVISSFDKLFRLEKLTQSLKRPSDAIIIMISQEETRKEICDYCAMFPNMRYLLVSNQQNEAIRDCYEKYGKAYNIRGKLEEHAIIFGKLQSILDQDDSNKIKIQDMIIDSQNNCFGRSKELDQLKKTHQWVLQNRERVKQYGQIVQIHETDCLEAESDVKPTE